MCFSVCRKECFASCSFLGYDSKLELPWWHCVLFSQMIERLSTVRTAMSNLEAEKQELSMRLVSVSWTAPAWARLVWSIYLELLQNTWCPSAPIILCSPASFMWSAPAQFFHDCKGSACVFVWTDVASAAFLRCWLSFANEFGAALLCISLVSNLSFS